MIDTSPGSLETLRRVNRARVLQALQQQGSLSRADIARVTGLSRTAVSGLVGELVTDGVIIERHDAERAAPGPSGGRPPTLLTLDPSSGVFVGVQLAHDGVRALIADRAGEPLADARFELDVDHRPGEAFDTAARLVGALLQDADVPGERIVGAGAAISAPLGVDGRTVASRQILPGWDADVDVAAELRARFGHPFHVGNDANLGALAEATFGAGRGVRNLVYVMLSAGVGAGLLLGGTLYEGETGTAGELGHVVVEPAGRICRCGNRGCLETVAGSAALIDALRGAHGPSLTFGRLLDLLAAGDPAALRVVADAGRALGRALAGICGLLNPGRIVIGGELAAGGDALVDGVRETLDRDTSPASGGRHEVVLGALGPTAEVRGAAVLAMTRMPSEALGPR